jgi:type VI secretion system protein VasD
MAITRPRIKVGVALSAALLSGCPDEPKVPEPCDTQVVTLDIYGSEDLNASEAGRPRPVVVRLYQLATDMRMQNAKYDDILFKDAETLKTDLMKVDEVELFPNDLVRVVFERIPEATILAGAAMVRDPQGHSWKTYYEFPPMPNEKESCKKKEEGEEEKKEEPQAFPKTEFYVVERKIDNGSQFDQSMFPNATPIRAIDLPKRSAGTESFAQAGAPAPGGAGRPAPPGRPQ